MNESISFKQANVDVRKKFLAGVYGWMALALIISAACALLTASSTTVLRFIFGNPIVFYGLIIGELAIVFILSARIRKMSVTSAIIAFIAYSVINGITLSSIFMVYSISSISRVFLVTAVMFGAMSLYGLKTKSDLSSMSRYLFMALIGVIIASVLNLLFRSTMLDWIISLVSVVVFTGLTAWDTQKLLRASEFSDGSETFSKVAIIGALELYLDFINIFLSLLRLFGRRSN